MPKAQTTVTVIWNLHPRCDTVAVLLQPGGGLLECWKRPAVGPLVVEGEGMRSHGKPLRWKINHMVMWFVEGQLGWHDHVVDIRHVVSPMFLLFLLPLPTTAGPFQHTIKPPPGRNSCKSVTTWMKVINDSNRHLGICFLGMFFYFIFLLSFSSSTDYLQIDYDHYLDHDHHLDLSNYENGRSKSSRGLETQQHVSSFRYNFFRSLFTSLMIIFLQMLWYSTRLTTTKKRRSILTVQIDGSNHLPTSLSLTSWAPAAAAFF